ncbi:MAG: hypothetical protein AUI50_01695 [Crenarchaeota archaeon 13_1_40CM_2_52_14]|nr:MAG: hypothetical protein AUI97_01090 [Crenarchaeota archaeon 13_1_40CM_3_52_17]OLD35541.1 MAG: hypothetical protein AUI50_01695 [Crenarchaeota archaeon 13_1_40CM_2_52_14]OLE85143.1 MAG: hypothetical protein AUF79_16910 [Crenarchaeota archaeon 13_1_20CM_2_51_8]
MKEIFYGMLQRLKIRAPIILGLLGSIVGLLYSYAVMSYDGDGCQCDWSNIQTFFGWPLIIGSVVGLAACVLYPVARKSSGIFILSGAILASPLTLLLVLGSWQNLGSLIFFSVLFFSPSYFASLLLFLGGLLALQKTRRIIKSLHDGGWIP